MQEEIGFWFIGIKTYDLHRGFFPCVIFYTLSNYPILRSLGGLSMDKTQFFDILCTSTPEEINEFISSKGKKKMVNAITFLDKEYINQLNNTDKNTPQNIKE